jgi:GTP cyclohydrolase I
VDIHDAIRMMIREIGDDPDRPAMRETPERVTRSWEELFSGYRSKIEDLFTVFDEPCDEMVLMTDIDVFSFCEHHLLPFYGKAHVAYIPGVGNNCKVLGASKLARIVEHFSRRYQIQERIVQQVTGALKQFLNPRGAACLIEATHFCVCARGVNKQGTKLITSSLYGAFKDNPTTRAEFLSLIKGER